MKIIYFTFSKNQISSYAYLLLWDLNFYRMCESNSTVGNQPVHNVSTPCLHHFIRLQREFRTNSLMQKKMVLILFIYKFYRLQGLVGKDLLIKICVQDVRCRIDDFSQYFIYTTLTPVYI